MCISAVLDGTIVALSAQFPSPPGIALVSRGVSHNLRPHESAASRCRCIPPALAQAGIIVYQLRLMTVEELSARCCMLLDIHHLFSHALKRKYLYLLIRKFCYATGEKICSVNLDRGITFPTLPPSADYMRKPQERKEKERLQQEKEREEARIKEETQKLEVSVLRPGLVFKDEMP